MRKWLLILLFVLTAPVAAACTPNTPTPTPSPTPTLAPTATATPVPDDVSDNAYYRCGGEAVSYTHLTLPTILLV